MINELNKSTEKYEKVHRRKSIWHRVISILSAVTVFITTYAMILPAITMEPSPGLKVDRSFRYETEKMLMIVHVNGRAVFADERDFQIGLSEDKVKLTVSPLEEESSVYAQYLAYAQENIAADLYELLTMRLNFTYDRAPLDMSNCQIDVEIVAKAELLNLGSTRRTPEDESRIFVTSSVYKSPQNDKEVMAITAYQGVSTDLSQQDTSYLTQDTPVLSVNTKLSGTTLAVALYSTVNPTFSVQYYSYTEVLASSGDKALDEIDTSGGKLPVNGGPNNMTQIWLDSVGSGKYVLATETKLLQVQKPENGFEYVKAPGVAYVDKLRQNGNYALKEVWVLKSGKSENSINKSDWTVYPATAGFTNREASANANRIYITDGTVIRLIYEETKGSYTNAADFYDYDISDGYTTSGGITTAVTANNGINSFAAAAGTVKYAFGNVNTNTNFGNNIWVNNGKNNTLNGYNSVNTAYDGCTFGLVTGINEDGTLIFANGISAPVLFGKTNGKGKTYFDDYSLQFSRSGDTYTLVAVNGTNTKNLDQFNNPSYTYNGSTTTYSHIFTNNFWPMDSASTWGAKGHDPVFGAIAKYNNKTVVGKNGSSTTPLPPGDDGLDHNSYFGMQYSLTFELTEDYTGPLEYVFYGDDDMWVFLDGQLVCDIGGVHSSVGQYVDLRDYIDKMPDSQKYGKHTLYFCYTERGASGSSCYMRFTLPSVTIAAPQVESSTLELSKQVLNATTDQEFDFEVILTDAEGNPLIDDYSYTRYDANGDPIESGIINNSTIVHLRHDEKIIVDFLPQGTKFVVKEIAADGFHSSHSINGGTTTDSETAEGDLNSSVSIQFINSSSAQLPSTGGPGVVLYAVPFILGFMMMLGIPIVEKVRKHRKKINDLIEKQKIKIDDKTGGKHYEKAQQDFGCCHGSGHVGFPGNPHSRSCRRQDHD